MHRWSSSRRGRSTHWPVETEGEETKPEPAAGEGSEQRRREKRVCVLLSIFQNNLFGSDFFRAFVLLGQRPDGNNTSFFHIHFYGSDFFRPKINANDVKTTFFYSSIKVCVCTVYLCVYCVSVCVYRSTFVHDL